MVGNCIENPVECLSLALVMLTAQTAFRGWSKRPAVLAAVQSRLTPALFLLQTWLVLLIVIVCSAPILAPGALPPSSDQVATGARGNGPFPHRLGAGRFQRSRFLRLWQLNRGAERGTGVKTGVWGKKIAEQAQGEAKVRRKVAPGRQVREKLRAGDPPLHFASARLGSASNRVPPEETSGRLPPRVPPSMVTLAKRCFHPTYYPARTCAGQSSRGRAPGAARLGAGGKGLLQKC